MHTSNSLPSARIPPRLSVRMTLPQPDPQRNYEPPCRRLRLTSAQRAARRQQQHEHLERLLAA